VVLGGAFGDDEPLGDLTVGEAFGDQPGNLDLARTQFVGSGLADTRLADTQNEATSPMARGVEPLPQPLELAPSSDDAVAENVHRILRRRTHATKHVPSHRILKATERRRPIEGSPEVPFRGPSPQPCPCPTRKAHFVVVTVASIPYEASSRASSSGS
jgi:hypothetical protein